MAGIVQRGVPIGLLGYLDGAPVAWCSIAPRHTYRDMGGPQDAMDGREQVWSLACLFVRRDLRGRGLTEQIIAAAVSYAQRNGATVVEATPVAPDSPSYRFMGFVPMFAAAGFQTVGTAGARRHVMRRVFGPSP
jgi:GNAT superfamily N-acetyltransferase